MKKNYNINGSAKTMEEAFRHSPSADQSMLEAVYMTFEVAMQDDRGADESKKTMHRRKGFALGMTAILALYVGKDKKRKVPASPAYFTKVVMEMVDDEELLHQVIIGSVEVLKGDFPFNTKDLKNYRKKKTNTPAEQEIAKIMVYDEKTQEIKETDPNDLPADIKDILMKIKAGEIKPKGK